MTFKTLCIFFSSWIVWCYHVLPTSTLATVTSLSLPGCSSAESCRVSAHRHANQWQTNPNTWSGSQRFQLSIFRTILNMRHNGCLIRNCLGFRWAGNSLPQTKVFMVTSQPPRGQQEADQRNLLVWNCHWNLHFVNDPDKDTTLRLGNGGNLANIWHICWYLWSRRIFRDLWCLQCQI